MVYSLRLMQPHVCTIRRFLASCLVVAASPGLVCAKTLIHAGRLIDGRADTARTSVTIVVAGDRIDSIADGFSPPAAGDTVIDLRTATLMPGLMDMHVHLSHEQQGAASYAEQFFLNPWEMALRATTYAKKTLLAGFTTVRDCGAAAN
jgi:imidazolonepropionase-like amidohydrolase